ncbi:unnamed protein product [Ilex paraguariensis]|uniref:Trichome birefringence-like N-terminal domain-containing protein n=1 Tax=Ilex paraguariensis TaxID=185542 RepID=A0ABC8UJM6_9AQUA
MGLWVQYCSFSVLLIAVFQVVNAQNCDFYNGNWVADGSYPLYDPAACPFIEREFSCQKNGRPDKMYLQYRWQPQGCELPRFDAKGFLQKLKGKSVMFVGDSLSRNQFHSLVCLIYTAMPNIKYNQITQANVSTFEIPIDMLIFNTWHWWYRRAPGQPWDYIEVGGKIYKDMDRMVAFEKALTTWAGWVDSNIHPGRNMVFFQGISPTHYNGSDWNEPSSKACLGQEEPILGSTYAGVMPPAVAVLDKVLSTIQKPVKLLNITHLSQLRKDGHPSIYGFNGPTGMDCIHWCLAGVPDTWNQILYNAIL